jgi:NAD(P)H dehydrogenase (quinone)
LLPGLDLRSAGHGQRLLRSAGKITPNLRHIKKLAAITTYGRARWVAILMDDPPGKLATRPLRGQIHRSARVLYLAHYHMNVSTPATRQRFLARVERTLARF